MRAGAREKREGWDTQHLMGWVGRAKDWRGGRVCSKFAAVQHFSDAGNVLTRVYLIMNSKGKIFETSRQK